MRRRLVYTVYVMMNTMAMYVCVMMDMRENIVIQVSTLPTNTTH